MWQVTRFVNPRRATGVRDGTLDDRLVQVITRGWPESRVAADPGCGKYKLPAPFGRRPWEFSLQRARQHDAAKARGQIRSMDPLDHF